METVGRRQGSFSRLDVLGRLIVLLLCAALMSCQCDNPNSCTARPSLDAVQSKAGNTGNLAFRSFDNVLPL